MSCPLAAAADATRYDRHRCYYGRALPLLRPPVFLLGLLLVLQYRQFGD